jgi:hypothetical protein
MRVPRRRGHRVRASNTLRPSHANLYTQSILNASVTRAFERMKELAEFRRLSILHGKFLCTANPTHGLQAVADIGNGELKLACGCLRPGGRFDLRRQRRQ